MSKRKYLKLQSEKPGIYSDADWQELADYFEENYNRLNLRTFRGNADPPITDKYTREHWSSKNDENGFREGFGDFLVRCEDNKLNSFKFRFFDNNDKNNRFIKVAVDCVHKTHKTLELSGCDFIVKSDDLFDALESIKNIFEYKKDFKWVDDLDRKTVFVVYGRNIEKKDAIFNFLTNIGLEPKELETSISKTEKTSPYIGEILDKAFDDARALVILLTPDEHVRLRDEFVKDEDTPFEKEGVQPRPNVIFEAGMAFGRNPKRTILIEFADQDKIRLFSDLDGVYTVRMDGSKEKIEQLIDRLKTAGCEVELKDNDNLENLKTHFESAESDDA